MIANTENSASAEDKFFNCLPEKLRCHLLPFQREGVAFGIERNGRYSHGSLPPGYVKRPPAPLEVSLGLGFRVMFQVMLGLGLVGKAGGDEELPVLFRGKMRKCENDNTN